MEEERKKEQFENRKKKSRRPEVPLTVSNVRYEEFVPRRVIARGDSLLATASHSYLADNENQFSLFLVATTTNFDSFFAH